MDKKESNWLGYLCLLTIGLVLGKLCGLPISWLMAFAPFLLFAAGLVSFLFFAWGCIVVMNMRRLM